MGKPHPFLPGDIKEEYGEKTRIREIDFGISNSAGVCSVALTWFFRATTSYAE